MHVIVAEEFSFSFVLSYHDYYHNGVAKEYVYWPINSVIKGYYIPILLCPHAPIKFYTVN